MLRKLLRKWAFAPKWHPRTDATPKGAKLWASDGEKVWEIWGDGEPINKEATKVHCWAVNHIPDPPAPRRRGEMVDTGGLNPPGGNPVRVRLSPPILDTMESFICTECKTRIYWYMNQSEEEYLMQKKDKLCMECAPF